MSPLAEMPTSPAIPYGVAGFFFGRAKMHPGGQARKRRVGGSLAAAPHSIPNEAKKTSLCAVLDPGSRHHSAVRR